MTLLKGVFRAIRNQGVRCKGVEAIGLVTVQQAKVASSPVLHWIVLWIEEVDLVVFWR